MPSATSATQRRRRWVLALASIMLLLVLPAGPAAAHTALLGADPAPGESLAYSPEEVLLRFATPVDPATLDVGLRSAEGDDVALRPMLEGSERLSTIAFGVPQLPHGVYGLTWSSVGDDGHRASGEVLFGVGVPPGEATVAGATTDPVATGLDLLAGTARVAWYLVLAGLAALAVLGRAGDPVAGRRGRFVAGWLADRRRRLLLWLAAVALLRAVVGSAIVLQAGGGASISRSVVLWTALAVGAGVSAVIARRLSGWVLLVAAVLLGTLAGHAPSREDPVLAVTFGAAHLGAAAVWVGPLLGVLAASRSARWRALRAGDRTAELRAAMARVAPAAGWALAVVLVSGALLALRTLDGGLVAGIFTWVLAAKAAIVLGVVVPLGVRHHRQRKRVTAVDRTWRVEVAGLVAVLALGSALVAVDPGWGGPVGGADLALAALLDGEVADASTCADLDVGRSACIRSALAAVLVDQGPQAAIDTMVRLRDDGQIAADCHQVAHDLGADAVDRLPDLGVVLEVEAAACASGYVHGAVEMTLAGLGDRRDSGLASVCASVAEPAYAGPHYNCVHGLGHGLMLGGGADLFTALEECGTLPDQWWRSSCASGAFMENVLAAQQGRPAAFDDRDLHYPCPAVPADLVGDCYLMQTSFVLFELGGDVAAAFDWCDTAPEGLRHNCYRSMGRDISGRALLDVAVVLADCSLGDPELRASCLEGAAANAVYDQASTDLADALCAAVTGEERRRCEAARDVVATSVGLS